MLAMFDNSINVSSSFDLCSVFMERYLSVRIESSLFDAQPKCNEQESLYSLCQMPTTFPPVLEYEGQRAKCH